MIRKLTALFLVIFLAVAVSGAVAQDEKVNVLAQVSKETITEEDIVQLIVSVAYNGELNNINVNLNNLRDFDKLGEQTSRNFSLYNDQASTVIRYVYNLFPKRKGTLTIPALNVDVNGKKYQTKPLTVHVVEGSGNTDVIVRYNTDKTNVTVGEQLLLSTEVLFRVTISDYDIVEQPNLEGFIVIDDPLKNLPVDEIVYNGMTYRRAILRRQILFPLSAGEKMIDPVKFRIQYRSNSFDFGSKIAVRTTNGLKIDVKPVPKNAPEGFVGAVGDYSIRWWADPTDGKSNEPITLKVELSGIGDIERAPDVKPIFPKEFEVINSSSESSARLVNGLWSGTKSWSFIVIPHESGEVKLGPLKYAFFNPEDARYQVASADAIALNLVKAEKPQQILLPATADTGSGEDDIRYIMNPGVALTNQGTAFVGTLLFWVLIIIPPAANILILAGGKLLGFARRNGGSVGRKRKALERALATLTKIRSAGVSKDSAGDLLKIKTATMTYFADKFELDAEGLSLSDVRSELVRYDLHESSEMEEVSRLLDQCEAQRYAPVQGKTASPEQLSFLAIKTLESLDKKL